MSYNFRDNLKHTALSAPNFFQFLCAARLLWWGIAHTLGIRFIITFLNPIVVFPYDYIIAGVGLSGLVGLFFNIPIINRFFGLANVFIASLVGLAFIRHASESISAGTYFIDMFGTIWLAIRLNFEFHKQKRRDVFNYD